MWTTVLVLALMTATEPVRLGMAIFLVTRPRPMVNLLAFWFGGMVTGIAVALSVLLMLRDFATMLMRHVDLFFSNATVGYVQVAVGVVALLASALIASGVTLRQPVPAAVPAGEGSAVLVEERPGPFARLMAGAQGSLGSGVPWVAFVTGLTSAGPPPVEYLIALTAIGASGVAFGTQLSATLAYLLVMLAIVEVPLACYLINPARTESAMLRLRDILQTHRRRILAGTIAILGAALLASGIGSL